MISFFFSAPEAPVLHVVNITATTLEVTWDPVQQNPVPLVGFKLFIHKPPDINGKKMIIHAAEARQHIFSNLGLS